MAETTVNQIILIIFDFDGVMTDNRVLVFEDGREAVFCNRADGQGISLLRRDGLKMLILSTETNAVVTARAAKLGIDVVQSCSDKRAAVVEIMQQHRVTPDQVMFVGNDVNDLDAMKSVGWPVAPSDAHASVLAIARHVTKARGGEGVVREVADLVLTGKGR